MKNKVMTYIGILLVIIAGLLTIDFSDLQMIDYGILTAMAVLFIFATLNFIRKAER